MVQVFIEFGYPDHVEVDIGFLIICYYGNVELLELYSSFGLITRDSIAVGRGFIKACENNKTSVIDYLNKSVLLTDAIRGDIVRGFFLACEQNLPEIVWYLIEESIIVAGDEYDKNTIYTGFMKACSQGSLDVIILLLTKNIVVIDNYKIFASCITRACENDNIETVGWLVNSDIPVYVNNRIDVLFSVLLDACRFNKPATVKIVLKKLEEYFTPEIKPIFVRTLESAYEFSVNNRYTEIVDLFTNTPFVQELLKLKFKYDDVVRNIALDFDRDPNPDPDLDEDDEKDNEIDELIRSLGYRTRSVYDPHRYK